MKRLIFLLTLILLVVFSLKIVFANPYSTPLSGGIPKEPPIIEPIIPPPPSPELE